LGLSGTGGSVFAGNYFCILLVHLEPPRNYDVYKLAEKLILVKGGDVLSADFRGLTLIFDMRNI